MSDLIIVGDRVLLEPQDGEQQTNSGLYLPATVTEKEKVGAGRVVRVGPGHLMANPEYTDSEPWTHPERAIRYLPLQAQIGDFAFYLRKEAIELNYQDKAYLIVSHTAILALVRPKEEDILEDIAKLFDDK